MFGGYLLLMTCDFGDYCAESRLRTARAITFRTQIKTTRDNGWFALRV